MSQSLASPSPTPIVAAISFGAQPPASRVSTMESKSAAPVSFSHSQALPKMTHVVKDQAPPMLAPPKDTFVRNDTRPQPAPASSNIEMLVWQSRFSGFQTLTAPQQNNNNMVSPQHRSRLQPVTCCTTEKFTSITSEARYANFSLEELRVAHYEEGNHPLRTVLLKKEGRWCWQKSQNQRGGNRTRTSVIGQHCGNTLGRSRSPVWPSWEPRRTGRDAT
jgi:hypothetical protein